VLFKEEKKFSNKEVLFEEITLFDELVADAVSDELVLTISRFFAGDETLSKLLSLETVETFFETAILLSSLSVRVDSANDTRGIIKNTATSMETVFLFIILFSRMG